MSWCGCCADDLVKLYTIAEQQLDELRSKLEDNIKSKKKELEAQVR